MTAPRTARADQARAVEATLSGRPWERLAVAGRALHALARDPEDTEQVFLLGICLNARKLPELLTRIALDPDGATLLEERPSIDSGSVDFDALRALPPGTLGREYVRFLDDNGLDPDLFQPPPGLPPIPTYVAKRIRQSHDLWHVVTGFGTDIPGEIGLQAFTHAQMRMPVSRILVALGLVRWSHRYPRMVRLVREGRRMGRRAAFLPVVRWERLFDRPLARVRADLGIEPVEIN
jgi:ubiquinone biosynthesis protein COQ4